MDLSPFIKVHDHVVTTTTTLPTPKALYMSLPLTLILSTLVCVVGLVIYANYHSCDPLLLGHVHARDQLLPFLVMDKLTSLPGLSGLFIACLFSVSLSSISSGLNALEIVILEDIVKLIWQWKDITPSPTTITRLAKLIGLLCGGSVIGVAFVSQFLGQTVLQIILSIFGMVGGPLLGLFISGIFIPFINGYGALAGLIVSAVLTFWVGVGGTVILSVPPIKNVSTDMCHRFNRTCAGDGVLNTTITTMTSIFNGTSTTPPPEEKDYDDLWIYHLSYLWYALFAVIVSLVTAFIVTIISSCVTEFNDPDNVDPGLIHNAVDRVCCYLPVSCQRIHRFEKVTEVPSDNLFVEYWTSIPDVVRSINTLCMDDMELSTVGGNDGYDMSYYVNDGYETGTGNGPVVRISKHSNANGRLSKMSDQLEEATRL